MEDASLVALVADETRLTPPPHVVDAVDAILARHGRSVVAVLFYGSALREADDRSKMLDFYVLSDSNHAFHRRLLPALFNWLLPPNVYHLSSPAVDGGPPVRAKYAVLTLRSFERRTSRRGIEPLGWGRFSQPCAIVYAQDDAIRGRVNRSLAAAAATMLHETLGLMPRRFTAGDIWVRALRESYGAELRAERAGRAADLYRHVQARYDRIADLVLDDPTGGGVRRTGPGVFEHDAARGGRLRAKGRWRSRRVAGKTLSALRVVKSGFTFDGGLDYILGKIEDHSGVAVTPTPWQQRHPILAAPALAWRLYRRGAFK